MLDTGGFHVFHIPVHEEILKLSLLSDLHVGSSHMDQNLLLQDLSRAEKNGDWILCNGDIFEMNLPSNKKQYKVSAIHPRLRDATDPINKSVDMAEEILAPFAERILLLGVGNHDVRGEKFSGVDPVLLLVDRLNESLRAVGSAHRILYGGYCGFLSFSFSRKDRFVLYYHHGWGGSGKASAAASDLEQLLQGFEGVDLFWLGHRHARLSCHVTRVSCPLKGNELVLRDVRFVRTGSYLFAHGTQSQESVERHGRRGNYVSEEGLPGYGLGGIRVEVQSSKEVTLIQ